MLIRKYTVYLSLGTILQKARVESSLPFIVVIVPIVLKWTETPKTLA